jgi:hypothetical protein
MGIWTEVCIFVLLGPAHARVELILRLPNPLLGLPHRMFILVPHNPNVLLGPRV